MRPFPLPCAGPGARLRRDSGITYIGVMIMVAVMGIGLMETGRYWSTIMAREREASLLYRGDQIRRAIGSYYQSTPQGRSDPYPRKLEDLLKDPRFLETRRHLRRLYPDPLDGKWRLILTDKGGIKGVFSGSQKKPLKKGNFPAGYEAFEKARSYRDWKFEYIPQQGKNIQGEPANESVP